MERLTIPDEHIDGGIRRTVIDAREVKKHAMTLYWKLKKYEDLEEQGLLMKCPCKLGDTVYEVQEIRKRIQTYTIISIHISNCSILFGWELKDGKGIYSNVNGFCDYAIGKTVFLTKTEAEEALRGMKGEE